MKRLRIPTWYFRLYNFSNSLIYETFQVEIIETKINDLLQYINNAMDMTRMVKPYATNLKLFLNIIIHLRNIKFCLIYCEKGSTSF